MKATGKWRERETGGGGHEIVDSDDTALTQRDVLKFGDGFKVSDDDTNEQTVANINNMQSGDMDDVITTLPSAASKKEGIKYSTTEQVIGEWIDGKPLYQKTFIFTSALSVSYTAWTQSTSWPGTAGRRTRPSASWAYPKPSITT